MTEAAGMEGGWSAWVQSEKTVGEWEEGFVSSQIKATSFRRSGEAEGGLAQRITPKPGPGDDHDALWGHVIGDSVHPSYSLPSPTLLWVL